MKTTFPYLKSCLLLATGAALSFQLTAASASTFPEQQVEVIVPYLPGGGTDSMARVLSAEAARITGKPWVVVNRDGAGGVVGFTALSRAKPNGYTISFSPNSPLTNAPFLNANMPFKTESIQPVCLVFENVFAFIVRNDSPFKTIQEVVEASKSRPKGLTYGHTGVGGAAHLGAASLARSSGAKLQDAAYRGDPPLILDVLAGNLDFGATAVSSLAGKSGFRILAVISDRRHPALPEVPAVTEAGYTAAAPGLNGLWAPAGTPKPVIDRLSSLCKEITDLPAFKERANALMQVPRFMSAEEFAPRVQAVYKFNSEVIPTLQIQK